MQHHNKAIIQAKPLHFSQTFLPEEIFEHLADQDWAIWLDSCKSEHVDSQFDIIVWQPEITLVTEGDNTLINDCVNQSVKESSADPLTLLDNELKIHFADIQIEKDVLPFISGALGFFSYDLGRRFEQLPAKAKKDINIPEMAVGIYNQALIFNNQTNQYSLICLEEQREKIEAQLQKLIASSYSNKKASFQLTQDWQANMTQKDYETKFDAIQHYLLSGDCYQINLTQRFSSTYNGCEFDAYKALRKENKAPFSAFIKLPACTILSISPERFLQLSNDQVQSKPIKGTKPRHSDPAIDAQNAHALLNSTKDKAENLMIVDLLRNDISKVCIPGSVKVPKLFDIESFPAIHHLVSTVEGSLDKQYHACDLLRASFPGGSITGAPKIRAMEIIDELEPQRRSIYCGSIGYISACGNMDTSITIRTLVCEENDGINTIHCWAGGGIVADSTATDEYQESFDKVNKILPTLTAL